MDRLSDPPLSPEQRAIVELSVEMRALVVAGPGTGKTHTLRHRIMHLAETEQIVASDELLVLSFTNAVVRELRERLADHPRASATRPITIDALARRIVGSTEALSHDRVMTLATEQVRRRDHAELGELRHLVVDEIQDLGDLRRGFVEALLQASDAGCTLLGDPAQGIYEFDNEAETDPVAELGRLPRMQTYVLTVEHRSLTDQVRIPRELRAAVVERDSTAWGGLRRHLRDIKPIGSLEQLATILRRSDSSTGLLSRTNGEILTLSQELHARGVPNQIKRRAEDVVIEHWPAGVLGGVTSRSLSRSAFADLAAERHPELDAALAWRMLKRIATATDGRSIDMTRLRARLLERPVDLRSGEIPKYPVLSTIHRSKGLQYDRVILHEPLEREDELLEESRVLYVAMTRARRRLVPLTRQKVDGRLRQGLQSRWTLRSWQGRPQALEARVGDTAAEAPPGGDAAAQTQQYIREMMRVGDPLRLRRGGSRALDVVHAGTVVATATAALVDALDAFGAGDADDIAGARVDAITTGVGDPSLAAERGLQASGLWLHVEMSGFLRVGGGPA